MSFIWSKKFKKPDTWIPDLRFFDETGQEVNLQSLTPSPILTLKDEFGNIIHSELSEYPEQVIVHNFLNEDSCVLELGARYGSVSCIIHKKLKQKGNQISVEPDETVWKALESNLSENYCNVRLYKGFVSKKNLDLQQMGYASSAVESSSSKIPSISLDKLQKECNLKFDTLVADCEGFLETFFDENPELYDQLHTVIFEADFPNRCNYDKIRNTLKQKRFQQIIYGFQNVYKK